MIPFLFTLIIGSFKLMKLNLNYWQTALLFLPFVAAVILSQIHQPTPYGQRISFQLINLLFNFNIGLVVSYQAWLAISFNNGRPNKAMWFNINAIIPAVFMLLYFLFVLYFTYTGPHNYSIPGGPMRQTERHFSGVVILLFFVYAAVNFYVVNISYVATQIKKVTDTPEKEQLKADFLSPMKRAVKMSFIIAGTAILLMAIADVMRVSQAH